MTVAVTGAVWALLSVLVYVVVAILVAALAIGVPGAVGKVVYGRARDEEMANPVAVGFGAAFFTLLLGLFLGGVVLLYAG